MESIDQASLGTFLQRQRSGVVASISATGTPQSALVGIAVTPALEIILEDPANSGI